MSGIEGLIRAYDQFVRLPWDPTLAPPQRVWFAVYDPPQERRLRLRLGEFEARTIQAGHAWLSVDLTDTFAHWMAAQEYRESYFEEPEDMTLALPELAEVVADQVRARLSEPQVGVNTVVAVYGVGSLFGLLRVSALVERVAPAVRGRLLVFFPGRYEDNRYRLLDARDGWNYLAVPITAVDD